MRCEICGGETYGANNVCLRCEVQEEIYAEGDGDAIDDRVSEPEDHFRDDVEADADVLAGIGWGTDEDYGYYGEDDWGDHHSHYDE